MVETVNYSRIEDGIATFIRSDNSLFEYPIEKVPSGYTKGDCIKVIIHSENEIEFIEKDLQKMQEIRDRIIKSRLLRRRRRK